MASSTMDKLLMRKAGRYRTSHLIEDQFETGSRGRVLKQRIRDRCNYCLFF